MQKKKRRREADEKFVNVSSSPPLSSSVHRTGLGRQTRQRLHLPSSSNTAHAPSLTKRDRVIGVSIELGSKIQSQAEQDGSTGGEEGSGMHLRPLPNPYFETPPDFITLARQFPDFAQYVHPRKKKKKACVENSQEAGTDAMMMDINKEETGTTTRDNRHCASAPSSSSVWVEWSNPGATRFERVFPMTHTYTHAQHIHAYTKYMYAHNILYSVAIV